MVLQFNMKLIWRKRIIIFLNSSLRKSIVLVEMELYYPHTNEYPVFYIHPLGDHFNHMNKWFLISASMFSHVSCSECHESISRISRRLTIFSWFSSIRMNKKHYNRPLCGNDMIECEKNRIYQVV